MNNLKRKQNSNEVIVNNKSNFKSHLVKSQTILDNIHFDELVLRAMGKAIQRARNLASQLNVNNYNTFDVSEKSYTVDIVEDKPRKTLKGANRDSFDPDAIDVTNRRVTQVPIIEIIVRKSKAEIQAHCK